MSGPSLSVARHARSLEQRFYVLVKGQALLIGGGRQFADINSADVPLVLSGRLVLSRSRQRGHGKSKQNNGGVTIHIMWRNLNLSADESKRNLFFASAVV
jgi:hypothetical protein